MAQNPAGNSKSEDGTLRAQLVRTQEVSILTLRSFHAYFQSPNYMNLKANWLEALLSLRDVTAGATWYHYVVSARRNSMVSGVVSLLKNPPAHLLKMFELSDAESQQAVLPSGTGRQQTV